MPIQDTDCRRQPLLEAWVADSPAVIARPLLLVPARETLRPGQVGSQREWHPLQGARQSHIPRRTESPSDRVADILEGKLISAKPFLAHHGVPVQLGFAQEVTHLLGVPAKSPVCMSAFLQPVERIVARRVRQAVNRWPGAVLRRNQRLIGEAEEKVSGFVLQIPSCAMALTPSVSGKAPRIPQAVAMPSAPSPPRVHSSYRARP